MNTPLNIDEEIFNRVINLWRATNKLYHELPVQLRRKDTLVSNMNKQNDYKWQHILYFGSSKKKNDLLNGLENLHQQIPMIEKLNEDLKKEEKTYRCLMNRVQKCLKDAEDLECATVHIENKILMLESLVRFHDEKFSGNRFWNKLINSPAYQVWQQTNQTYLNQLNDYTEKYIALREDLEQKEEEINRYNLHLKNIDKTVLELEEIIERFARQQEELSAKYRIF
jgi:DNA repair exonuclease SbcCD ATPase subunit